MGAMDMGAMQNEILNNPMVSTLTLWQEFREGPFLFQHKCAPAHTKQGPKRHGWVNLLWKNLTGPRQL